jgi:hypothetical protein
VTTIPVVVSGDAGDATNGVGRRDLAQQRIE